MRQILLTLNRLVGKNPYFRVDALVGICPAAIGILTCLSFFSSPHKWTVPVRLLGPTLIHLNQ